MVFANVCFLWENRMCVNVFVENIKILLNKYQFHYNIKDITYVFITIAKTTTNYSSISHTEFKGKKGITPYFPF